MNASPLSSCGAGTYDEWVRGLLVLLLLLAGVPSATGAGAIDWKRLPYFNYNSPQLLLTTDGSWSGADVVDVGPFKPSPPNVSGFEKLKRNYIWAPTCDRSQQRRSFSKTIMVPGAPIEGTFNLGYGPGRDRPFLAATLSVNGIEIARLPRTAGKGPLGVSYRSGPLSRRARQAFRYGANTVVITATKAALKKGERCNDPKVPRYVGVIGDLYLVFGADLRVSPPSIPNDVVRNVVNEQSVSVRGTVQFTNAGPSAALRGEMKLSVYGDGQSAVVTAHGVPGPPFHDCKVQSGGSMLCAFREFRAKQKASYTVIVGTKVNTGFFRNGAGRMNVQVTLFSTLGDREPNGRNNTQQKKIALCMAGATDPACK